MSGQKNQDLNTLYSHSQSALCYVPFLDFGDNKLEIICFCCKIKHDFPCGKHFLPGLHPLRKIHFLFSYYNLYFSFIYFLNFHFIPLRDWWRGFRGLLILWKLEVDWDWRISCACFRVSDEIRFFDKALTKAIVICSKNDHTSNEKVSKIFEFTLSALLFKFGDEIAKALTLKLAVREELMAENGKTFPSATALTEFIQNRI